MDKPKKKLSYRAKYKLLMGGYSNEENPVNNSEIRSFGIEKLQFKKFNEIDDKLDELAQNVIIDSVTSICKCYLKRAN